MSWHFRCVRTVLWVIQRDWLCLSRLSSSAPFFPLQMLTQPCCHDNSNPCRLFFDAAKYSKPPCCCDLPGIAVPSQVAAFLGEPFQIKAFSQKTLKSHCRQALNKRTHFLPVSSPALTGRLSESTTSYVAKKKNNIWLLLICSPNTRCQRVFVD